MNPSARRCLAEPKGKLGVWAATPPILFPHFDLRTERYQILFISFYIYLLSAFWKLMFLLICQNDVEQKVGHSDILQQGKLGAEARVVKVHISYLLRHSTLLSLPFLYFVFNF